MVNWSKKYVIKIAGDVSIGTDDKIWWFNKFWMWLLLGWRFDLNGS